MAVFVLDQLFRIMDKNEIVQRLSKSKFRSKFILDSKMNLYIKEKSMNQIENHARDFVKSRIAPENIPNDGKQTPFKSHPVFVAQHATATCCRKCINKWHKIAKNRELTLEEQNYIVELIIDWIKKNIN